MTFERAGHTDLSTIELFLDGGIHKGKGKEMHERETCQVRGNKNKNKHTPWP
jgi:hypothetical protein